MSENGPSYVMKNTIGNKKALLIRRAFACILKNVYSLRTSTVIDPVWLSLLMFKIYIPALTLRLIFCP